MASAKRTIMDAEQIELTLDRMAAEIREARPHLMDDIDGHRHEIAVVGIRTRGVFLAERLTEKLRQHHDLNVQFGVLDINLYRDDLSLVADHPVLRKTEIPFPINGTRLVLVDDVLFTGRTVRAALDALTDLGRPKVIELAVLVDRGNRELPIRADYVGHEIQTGSDQWIRVLVNEEDGADRVELGEVEPKDREA